MEELARGFTSRVYKLDIGDRTVVKKQFDPIRLVRVLYYLAFQSPYPYNSNKDALQAVYFRRRIAHKISKAAFGENSVADAYDLDLGDHALYCEFVEGSNVNIDKNLGTLLNEYNLLFRTTGLPSWQFSRFNPTRYRNVIVDGNSNYRIIDLEAGVPFPPWKFDEIDFGRLANFSQTIEKKLTPDEYAELLREIDQCKLYTERWKNSERAVLRKLQKGLHRAKVDPEFGKSIALSKINSCLDRISKEYNLDERKVGEIYLKLDPKLLQHSGVHIAISLAPTWLLSAPLLGPVIGVIDPVSSISRFSYTVGNWYRARKNKDKDNMKLHNPKVALTSLIPKAGAVSYLLVHNFKAGAIILDEFYYERIGKRENLRKRIPIIPKDLPLFKRLVVNKLKKN